MRGGKHIKKRDVQEWRIYKNVISVSVGFTILFWSFGGVANIQSSINKMLGITALWVIYVTFIISCLFVPSMVSSRLSTKWTMPLCMIPYSLYIAAQFYPRYWTLVPSGFLVGLVAAPLWSSKSSYLTEISQIYSITHKKKKELAIARMFGIFFFIFNLAKIIGNYIVSAVLSSKSETITMPFEEQDNCGADFCPVDLRNLSSFGTGKAREQDEQQRVTMLISIFFVCSLIGALVMSLLVEPIASFGSYELDLGSSTDESALMATFRQLRRKKQLLLVPLTFWSGSQKGFISLEFTAAYITCSSGVALIGYVLICMGVFDSLFSIIITSYLVKFTGRIPVYITMAIINLGIFITLLVWKPHHSNNWVLFVIAALWGLCDAVWQTQTNALYGTLFSKNSVAAFSNYNLFKAAGFMVACLISGFICVNVKLYILIANLILAMFGYCWLEVIERSCTDLTLDANDVMLGEERNILLNEGIALEKNDSLQQ